MPVVTDLDQVMAIRAEALAKLPQLIADKFIAEVKMRTPVDTGRLQEGWQSEVTPTHINISNDVPYAGYVEMGTAHHAPVGMAAATVNDLPIIIYQSAKELGL